MKRAKISAKSVQILFSEQQMAEKRPNGCGAIARNRNPLMICAKKNSSNNNNNNNNDNNNINNNNNNIDSFNNNTDLYTW